MNLPLFSLTFNGHYHLSLYLTYLASLIYLFQFSYNIITKKCVRLNGIDLIWLLSVAILLCVYFFQYFIYGGHLSYEHLIEIARVATPVLIIYVLSISCLSFNNFSLSVFLLSCFFGIQTFFDIFLNGFQRSSGLFQNEPIIFGSSVALIGSICYYLFLINSKSINKAIMFILGVVLTLIALLATQSRGPLVSYLLILIMVNMYFLFYKKYKLIVSIILLFLMMSIPLMINFSGLRSFQFDIEPVRLHLWDFAINTILDNPFGGIGSDNITDELRKFIKLSEFRQAEIAFLKSSQVHNIILQSFLSFGILFGFLPLMIIFYPLWLGLKIMKNYTTELSLQQAHLLIIASLSFLISGMTDDVILSSPSLLTYLLFVTIILRLQTKNE